MANKLNINVQIEGIQLPITVSSPDEEKLYRDAAASIQRRLQYLRDQYPNLPNQHHYVMAMLLTSVAAKEAINDIQPYVEMIHDIEKEIEALGIK